MNILLWDFIFSKSPIMGPIKKIGPFKGPIGSKIIKDKSNHKVSKNKYKEINNIIKDDDTFID